MDWDKAKKHCEERNWLWTLDLIEQAQKEVNELENKVAQLEEHQKAQRLYNSCNY